MTTKSAKTLTAIRDAAELLQASKRAVVLTGAGISAESGIPTFRGPEGYWTVGSRDYHPQEMATFEMFNRNPEEVWRWYLYRLGVCRAARPNPGHLAIVELERLLGDRFTLITQNVDGLHLRAGNSPGRTFQIHGNIHFMRCARECVGAVFPLPDGLAGKGRSDPFTDADRRLLVCPACGGWVRPHVLWFDETYDEENYRWRSSLEAAARTALLLVVGTSGATNLPNRVAAEVFRQGGGIVDVNPEENPFSRLAEAGGRGYCLREPSGDALPRLLSLFREGLTPRR